MRGVITSLLFAGLVPISALADVVTLKDGSKREGRVVKQDEKHVVLEVAQGRLKAQITLERSEVKSIEKGETANEKLLKEAAARRKKLKKNDAAGWLAYARWLERQNGFSKDARAAYEKVIAIQPEDETARRRLGYQKVGGQWLTEDEVMIAKGFVKHRGRWMRPEEKAEAAEKKDEDIRIASAEEIKKGKADADARAQAKWRRDMAKLMADKAARCRAPGQTVTTDSGGVVLGRWGHGLYGVHIGPNGQYIPFVPATGVYTTFDGCCLGTWPCAYTSSGGRYVHVPFDWGVRWTDSHWDVRLGSGGAHINVTIK